MTPAKLCKGTEKFCIFWGILHFSSRSHLGQLCWKLRAVFYFELLWGVRRPAERAGWRRTGLDETWRRFFFDGWGSPARWAKDVMEPSCWRIRVLMRHAMDALFKGMECFDKTRSSFYRLNQWNKPDPFSLLIYIYSLLEHIMCKKFQRIYKYR